MSCFLINVITKEKFNFQYYDLNFTDEMPQLNYNSVAVPGEIDSLFYTGSKQASSTLKVYFEGNETIKNVEKLKKFCGNSDTKQLYIRDLPPRFVLISAVSSSYNFANYSNKSTSKAETTISFFTIASPTKWWEKTVSRDLVSSLTPTEIIIEGNAGL